MKQILKFVALLVTGALVILPALASLPCAFGATVACAPGCPMATMSTMGPDCPMSTQLSATDCPQNCCNPAPAQVIATPAATPKLSLAARAPFSAPLEMLAESQPLFAAQTPIDPQFASQPRYILIRNFRI